MGQASVVPQLFAEIVREHLQRAAPALAHNISEERLADWQADPEIRAHLVSITCLDLHKTLLARNGHTTWKGILRLISMRVLVVIIVS